jgi:hypothetical protein
MAVAAHTTVIKQTGTAVAMTSEATSSLSASVYQITDATKRIIEPDIAITVTDNGAGVADADYTVDLLFGKVTKVSGNFTGPVLITAAYLPTYAVAEATGFEINCTAKLLETTKMAAATANRERMLGLRDASGSVSGLDTLTTDIDSGGTTLVPLTDFHAGTRRVLEVTFPGGVLFRAFVRFSEVKQGGEVDDVFKSTLNWQADAAKGADQTEASSFGFSAGG